MRKKIFVPIAALVVILIVAFTAFNKFTIKNQVTSTLLNENIEALTQGEVKDRYFVHHSKYYDPITNLVTNKCYAFCYKGPNGPCSSSHSHTPSECCSIQC